MSDSTLLTSPHRRWNPLKQEWVLVSPQRTQRPWQGQTEDKATPSTVEYDPACYLCPGNNRASGLQTPQYPDTYVFENDYAALTPSGAATGMDQDGAGLLRAISEQGICRVLCFDPRHDQTLATMEIPAVRRVVDTWAAQAKELSALPNIAYVQIFENRGAMMGASNPHPHGQIWATEHIPNEPAREFEAQTEYFAKHGKPLLLDYAAMEFQVNKRIVAQNSTWIALVPFWAVWPFEVMLLPRQQVARIEALDEMQRNGLAEILGVVTRGYNRVFETPFPYSMGFHPAPADGEPHTEWQLHAHFYPPLLRSATVRKFMVGFELLGSPQRDITPEVAAATLRQAMQA